jgi:thioredoxin reductase (NADPH)
MSHHHVIIIGSGPAGLTRSHLARAPTFIRCDRGRAFEHLRSARRAADADHRCRELPGFRRHHGPRVDGQVPRASDAIRAEFLTEKVTAVDFSERPFKVSVRDRHFTADAVIVSTGAQSLMLGLEAESRLLGYGLSTCATCDGFFFRGQEIAVAGGGDSAVEEATFLTKFASKVILIHRRDTLRASKIMQERALNNPKIEIMWNTVVEDLVGDTKLEGAVVRNVVTGEATTLPVTGLFVAIGHRPNTDLFKGLLDMDDNGYLITQPGSSYTNIAGVFACGDVQDHTYRQAITAAGSGCMARSTPSVAGNQNHG